MKTIILTGGGTAGHVMPNLALIPELKKHFNKIYYIGSKDGIERKIIKSQTSLEYYDITTTKLRRSLSLKNLCIPFKLFKGIREAKKHLRALNPKVIFSKGGFVSVPIAIAAKKLNIPIVSHESDLTLGLANKIIYRYCKVMCTSFEDTLQQVIKKGIFTGSPIRQEIFNGNKENILNTYKLNKKKQTLLFMGGSLGAKTINEQVFNLAKDLTKKYNVLHLVGKNNINNSLLKLKSYIQVEFTNKIEDFYSVADLVISRAGSNVIFELLALKKPMLLIPLSKKASRGDQILNANYFKEKGYAKILYEENLTKNSLIQKIQQALFNKTILVSNMNANKFSKGNQAIIKQILKYSH